MIVAEYDRSALCVRVTGHACSGQPGKDLVCAAATMLVCTLAADIERLHASISGSGKQVALESGRAELSFSAGACRSVAAVVFDSVCAGFALLAQHYPQAVIYREIKEEN
nr:MAG TPA: YsxB-like protein [Caudoviricetes sp.]